MVRILALAALAAPLVAAMDFSSPAANSTVTKGKDFTLSWNTVDTDPTKFSIYLVNFVNWPPFYTPLAYNVETAAGQTKVKVPCSVDNSYGYQLYALPPPSSSPPHMTDPHPQQRHQRHKRLRHLHANRKVLRRRRPLRRLDAAPRAAHLRRAAGRRHGYRHRHGEQAHLFPSFRPPHQHRHHCFSLHHRRPLCHSWKMSLHDRLGHRRLRKPRDANADAAPARAGADGGAGWRTRGGGRGGVGDEDGVFDCV